MNHPHRTKKIAPAGTFAAPSEICALLRMVGTPETVPPGTILFRMGNLPMGVFLVLRGRVALSAGNENSLLTRIASKGSLLGLPSTVNNKPYSLTAEALSEVTVCRIPPHKFREMLTSNPVLGMAVVNILSDEVSSLRASRLTLTPC